MAAFTASQAKVDNGSKVVQINSGESVSNVRGGDFLVLSNAIVEINRAYIGADNKGYFELVKNWPNSNQSNQPCIVIPTTAEFKTVVAALNEANALVNDNYQAMQAWQTQMGTVTFVNKDKTTTTVKTLKQIEADNLAQMNAYHPHPWAMRKVEFEARRAANNEKFAASGFVHFGKHADTVATPPINEGMFTRGEGNFTQTWHANKLWLGRVDSYATGVSKENYPVLNIAGVLTELYGSNGSQNPFDGSAFIVKFPPAEDGTRTYDSTTGVSVKHTTSAIAFASETATNKVVTDRVDMWGFEGFLREINDTDPFVYKNGLIQSQAPDINGVGTVLDNVRPITYFAWYTGDTTSRGKGVNWQTATESQRIAIASDPDNNIYFDDSTGKFYQWCIQGRSFAGMGNGHWKLIDTTSNENLTFSNSVYVAPIGFKDSDIAYYDSNTNSDAVFYPKGKFDITFNIGVGLYQAGRALEKTDSVAVNGECYFLVCGTVNRLNTGAYHPSFNPLGSCTFWDAAGSISSNLPFTDSRITKPTSKSDCFNFQVGSVANRGSIATGVSGRPDGRYYDAIYASGQGGVCRDMRYSAWGLKAEDFAEAGLKIKASKYRGREVLRKFAPAETLGSSYYYNSNNLVAIYGSNIETDRDLCLGDIIWVKPQDAPRYYSVKIIEFASTYIKARLLNEESPISDGVAPNTQIPSEYWLPQYIETSISDEYTHTEVIGNPSEILRCEDLKNGWVGGWNPVLPSTSAKDYDLTRPSLSVPVIKESTDLGSSWTEITTGTWDSLENAFVGKAMQSTDTIWLLTYKSKAKLTTDSIKGVVHGGDKGLGDVYVCSWGGLYNQGRDLGYSLISKVLVGANSYSRNMTYKLSQGGVDSSGQLPISVNYPIKHPVVDINPVESPAFKVLNYNSVENQQAFINYAYTELHYDTVAGDWGDDGEIHIANNQTTMPDENGHTVFVGTARCVETLGWLKNDK